MAGTLDITEIGSFAGTCAAVPPIAEQTISTSGSSAQSNALNAATQMVRLHAATIVSVAFGLNPTATTGSMRMAAGQTEYFRLPSSNGRATAGYKIAAIDNT